MLNSVKIIQDPAGFIYIYKTNIRNNGQVQVLGTGVREEWMQEGEEEDKEEEGKVVTCTDFCGNIIVFQRQNQRQGFMCKLFNKGCNSRRNQWVGDVG